MGKANTMGKQVGGSRSKRTKGAESAQKKSAKNAVTKRVVKTAAKKAVTKRTAAKKKSPQHARTKAPAPSLSPDEIRDLQEFLGIPHGSLPRKATDVRHVTAHHEAGHAVIGHLLGRTLSGVSVIEHCNFEPLHGEWSEVDLKNAIRIALAGPHAEVIASIDGVSAGGGADFPDAKDHAEELASSEWKALLKELSDEAQVLVLEHWRMIARVAERLKGFASVMNAKDLTILLQQAPAQAPR